MKTLADYTVVVFPDDNGTFVAHVREIPGCHALGNSAAKARNELEHVFAMICEEEAEGNTALALIDETSYWSALEFRVCRELTAMSDKRVSSLWCDGFIPSKYNLNELPPNIMGKVWVCNGQIQQEWAFTLLLKSPASKPEEIDWRSLLPSEDETEWLTINPTGQTLQINCNALVSLPNADDETDV